ncbi:MAG: type IV pili methyl-accepting chemotaxis transducer N-terminal domain-containing protein [Pseudomonadota bacterium]
MMITRRNVLAGAIASTSLISVDARAITDEAALAAERRIDIAGFQRTRIKLIAKAACFAHAGVAPEKDFAIMARETAAVSDVFVSLRNGNPRLGLKRETHSKVLAALREATALWLPYSERAAAIAERGSLTEAELDYLIEKEPALFDAMDEAVGQIQQTYGSESLPLHLAVATNLAGRQRSLGQEVAKDVCLIAIGYAPEETRTKLVETMALFENTHGALAQGMPMLGIRAPAQPALAQTYVEVGALWTALKELAMPALDGEALDRERIVAVDMAAEDLTAASDAAVKLYRGEN